VSYPHRLLTQARHLATKERLRPQQASLRRAVSAAYYALFHLLVKDGARLLAGSDSRLARLVARSFNHGEMKTACETFAALGNPGRQPPQMIAALYPGLAPFPELERVAQAFVDLQRSRHAADYSSHQTWTRTEALEEVVRAEGAFADWEVIRPQRRRPAAVAPGPPPPAPAPAAAAVAAPAPAAPAAPAAAALGAAAPVPVPARVPTPDEVSAVRLFLAWLTLQGKVKDRA
jgi:uncharacterized protein (UPF0332 family)